MSDDELREWQAQWHDQAPGDTAHIHVRAVRENRRHRVLAIAEYAMLTALLFVSLVFAAWRDEPALWWGMAAIWILGVPALVFAWWNRRGLWGSAGASAHEHVALSLQRSRHGLRALRVGYVLLAASTFAVLAIALAFGDGARLSMLGVLVIVVAAHLVVMLLMHVRLRRRVRVFESLMRDAGDDTP
ncbi:hypothetical protein ACQQ2N_16105 [Dokdonella sp. MW10]|uniref:hypothetical protein n=1 Tax=Dokdonella sp. MW10 TaxID=2992926 RepID=UPI003F80B4AE